MAVQPDCAVPVVFAVATEWHRPVAAARVRGQQHRQWSRGVHELDFGAHSMGRQGRRQRSALRSAIQCVHVLLICFLLPVASNRLLSSPFVVVRGVLVKTADAVAAIVESLQIRYPVVLVTSEDETAIRAFESAARGKGWIVVWHEHSRCFKVCK